MLSLRLRMSLLAAAGVVACVAAGLGAQETAPATMPVATAAQRLSPALPSGGNAAIIRLDGVIYDFTLESLKARVDRAVQGGASLIVLELDTNGGLVTSAMDISKYIKTIPVPTVAWVNNKAYSAGIMIASACDATVMAPSSAMGDCAPIVPGQNLSATERAKALSPILAEFRDNARRNGYDFAAFHAMCELGVEVYEVENPRNGEKRFVERADYERLVRGIATATAATATPPDEEEQPEPVREADRGAWQLVRQVHDGKSLLTVHQTEAMSLRLSRAIVSNQNDLQQFLGAKSLTLIDLPWVEGVAYWLTRPWVRAILMIILLVGGYYELQTPGMGVGGTLAGVALLLLLVAPFLVGLAEVWQLLLFALGFVLLMIELFLIPGFGIVGILGIIFMFAGLVLSVVPTAGGGPVSLPPPEMWRRLQESIMWMMVSIIFSGVGLYYLTRYFGHLPLVNRLVLKTPSAAPAGVPGAPGAPGGIGGALSVSGDEAMGFGRVRVGATGRVISQLRPSGRAQVDGMLIDVVTSGDWIEPGGAVRVVEVSGNRIVVERA